MKSGQFDNVASIFRKVSEKPGDDCLSDSKMKDVPVSGKLSGSDTELSDHAEDLFRSAIQRNIEIQERLKADRLRANRSVLKSYRLKK
ncbi:MAG: hypothetical protein H6618_07360 [Deltaproteobacteria bacterium]|nr:hypothetical protein [Deltaproteobacteria bacterium]